MSSLRRSIVAFSIALFASLAAPGRAQCFDWVRTFAANPNETVYAMLVFDDGSGPALYIGGDFTRVGDVDANRVAKWDGTTWTALGDGMNNSVRALGIFDDGSGPALYAGGFFTTADGGPANRIAKWDGASWSALGTGLTHTGACWVYALGSWDDGSGSALYVGGQFSNAGGVSTNDIARWNGTTWSSMGTGTDSQGGNWEVRAFQVFDDGSGTALFVGGTFPTMSGVAAGGIATWNGTSWSGLGTGISSGAVRSFAVHDDGSGVALFAGGTFSSIGGTSLTSGIAKWNGTSWLSIGGGVGNSVNTMATFDDGTGPALFISAGTAGIWSTKGLAKWDGTNWSDAGTDGIYGAFASAVFDDGTGPALYTGGDGSNAQRLGRLKGFEWSLAGLLNAPVRALAAFDAGSGPVMYAGGEFTDVPSSIIPTTLTRGIARYEGTRWRSLSSGLGGATVNVLALAVSNVSAGDALYVGGQFTTAGFVSASNVARWSGSAWAAVGSGTNGDVAALAEYDDGLGPKLFAGGSFTIAGGGSASYVAGWDGTSWFALGSGMDQPVSALVAFDDGSGANLYAGGEFVTADGNSATYIARWDGSGWSDVGGGMNGPVSTLVVFDDGSGPALYAGGDFTDAGGTRANHVAKWDGTAWSALGLGTNARVSAFSVSRDLDATVLYAGGDFTTAGGASAKRIARWDGSNWVAVGLGLDAEVLALGAAGNAVDAADALFVGGTFTTADADQAPYMVRRLGCTHDGESYCGGDGVDPVVTALCPCANYGDPGRGCANSNSLMGGAKLTASGTTSPNNMLLTCAGIPNNNLATFLRGSANNATGTSFGDGVRCVSGTTLRFGQQLSGPAANPNYTVIATPPTTPPGTTRYYQCHYRAPGGFCPPELFNLSNAYRVTW